MVTAYDVGKKALAGIEFVPIHETDEGLKVYRKHLKNSEVLPYVQELLLKALQDIVELQNVQENARLGDKPSTVQEVLFEIKSQSALFVTSSCNDFHRMTRIIERVQQALAILKFVAGDEIFKNEYSNYLLK